MRHRGKTAKVEYYGKDLAQAYELCMSDQGHYDGEKSYRVLKADLAGRGYKVAWSKKRVEKWQFIIRLTY